MSKLVRHARVPFSLLVALAAAWPLRGDDALRPAEESPPAAGKPTAEDLLSKVPQDKRTPDLEAMARAIAAGKMGPNQGWYRPGESRYGWEWLRARLDKDADEGITADELRDHSRAFKRLDRDRNGQIKADDFDWTDDSPYMKQLSQSEQLFRRLDASSDGRISSEEWAKAFERLKGKQDEATSEDLRALLFPPAGSRDRPKPDVLLAGLISGEIGSHQPGPSVGDLAPEFQLRTHDGTRTVRLADFRGDKPVVLIFGSFT
jgi:Ca2+-binding EF-hand superfamily protein